MNNFPLKRALIGLGLLMTALSPQAHAQLAAKTVTIVVPFAAGGGTDTVARLIGERMARTLGQTVIVENVVGGGSTLANDRVARSTPDGSTILINHVALLAAPSTRRRAPCAECLAPPPPKQPHRSMRRLPTQPILGAL